MSALITLIHNYWLQIPEGLRMALSYSAAVVVAAALGLVQSFGWFFPTSVVDVQGQVIAFLTYAVPVLAVLVAQLVRSQIAPAIVQWFLSTFGYATARQVIVDNTGGRHVSAQAMQRVAGITNLSRWVKAA